MERDFLSDIELFYTENVTSGRFVLAEDEAKHAARVMRKKIGDEIYAADGKGNIYKGKIISVEKKTLAAEVLEKRSFTPEFPNVVFYVPLLRNKERLRFALEKLVELGFTRITFYSSERTLPKNFNIGKWRKSAVAAMKQSLRAVLPALEFLPELNGFEKGENVKTVLLDQTGKLSARTFAEKELRANETYAVFIGPEGDFTESEKKIIDADYKVNLGGFRLRSETAVVYFASVLKLFLRN